MGVLLSFISSSYINLVVFKIYDHGDTDLARIAKGWESGASEELFQCFVIKIGGIAMFSQAAVTDRDFPPPILKSPHYYNQCSTDWFLVSAAIFVIRLQATVNTSHPLRLEFFFQCLGKPTNAPWGCVDWSLREENEETTTKISKKGESRGTEAGKLTAKERGQMTGQEEDEKCR